MCTYPGAQQYFIIIIIIIFYFLQNRAMDCILFEEVMLMSENLLGLYGKKHYSQSSFTKTLLITNLAVVLITPILFPDT